MEWLENLLKEAKITDGKLDIAAIMAAVKKEFPNHAVPKQEFNEALEAKKKLERDIKTRDRQLEELKKENGNAEELQEQIKKLQEENKQAQKKYDEDMKEIRLTSAIKAALTGKAQDEDIKRCRKTKLFSLRTAIQLGITLHMAAGKGWQTRLQRKHLTLQNRVSFYAAARNRQKRLRQPQACHYKIKRKDDVKHGYYKNCRCYCT